MRWLDQRFSRREDGVTAVFVAVFMVVILGMAGYVIDIGVVRQEKRELQNGADAGALALAQECALGLCTNLTVKAQPYADGNAKDGTSLITGVTVVGATVKVDTRTRRTGGATSLPMQFVQLVGGPANYTVNATATAGWGAPGSATTVPLALSYCQWNSLTGNNTTYPTAELVILFKGGQVPPTCFGPAGQNMPGGFGWLDTISPCRALVTAGGQVGSDPGNGNVNNNGCQVSDFLNKDVLFPVFKQFTGNGNNGVYTIYGLATFHITGMRLANNGGWATNPAPCAASTRCVKGYFLRDIIPWTGGALGGGPALGTDVVKLIA